MNLAETEELRIFEAGNHPEDPLLFRKLQMILKTDDVVTGLHQVFLSELNNGIRNAARRGIIQSDRPHRTEAQCVDSTPGEFFDRQA